MKKILGVLFLLWAQNSVAESWLHVSGLSWHDRPGYQEINTGIGFESSWNQSWNWAVGTFQNSIDRQSVYALAKYRWWVKDDLAVNLNLGGVTGYRRYAVAPVILPEACVGWLCAMFIPRIGDETTAAAAVYLRIPL